MVKKSARRTLCTEFPLKQVFRFTRPLLGKVIAENDPAMWGAISEVMAEQLVTASEMALLKMVRQGLNGHDVDLTQSQAFVAATAPVLKATLERQNALKEAALIRSDD
jgi:hypothetical protein